MAEHKQFNLEKSPKKLEDFFVIRGGVLNLVGVLQTNNFISGKSGVQIKGEGLSAGSISIAGSTSDSVSTVIPGALKHTGNTVGFYNTTPISKQTVTLGNVNSAIGGLTISAAYSQGEVQAFRDATETLADDVRAIKAALVNVGLIN
jgi:hypothetical protein